MPLMARGALIEQVGVFVLCRAQASGRGTEEQGTQVGVGVSAHAHARAWESCKVVLSVVHFISSDLGTCPRV